MNDYYYFSIFSPVTFFVGHVMSRNKLSAIDCTFIVSSTFIEDSRERRGKKLKKQPIEVFCKLSLPS